MTIITTHTEPESIVRSDDTTRTVQTLADDGSVFSSRPYTEAENAEADQRTVQAAERAAHEAGRAAVKAIVTDLQAEKTRLDTVIAKSNASITGADTKEVARAAKRIADAAIDLSRLVKDL